MVRCTPRIIFRVMAWVWLLSVSGCALDEWNPPKTGYIDQNSGCPRYLHNVRGPDDYDIAHGKPYHCEMPQDDPDFVDIDQVDQ